MEQSFAQKNRPNEFTISDSEIYSVRLVNVDYYLSYPVSGLDVLFSEFRGVEIKQVPIVRIFGSNPRGEKTCLHVHGVFPYLLIPCESSSPESQRLYQIANSIDKALNISLKQANSNTQHVYLVSLVRGIPFYGYHGGSHQFYKIFFYNPVFVKRTADLLQNGAIMGLSYQPHEAHINFIMQFFIDFNLYGMSYINIECAKFRKTSDLLSDDSFSDLPPTSVCKYEIDCLSQHIQNRKGILDGQTAVNPGLDALWEDEKVRLRRLNLSDNLAITPSQPRYDVRETESHTFFQKKLLTRLALYSEDGDLTLTESVEANDSEKSIELNTEESIFDKTVYPVESSVESQILNANDITFHRLPTVIQKSDENYSLDNSVVDEQIALQLSQEFASQINSQDKDLIALLENMQQEIEENSILGSQPCENNDECIEENLFEQNNDECNEENLFEQTRDECIEENSTENNKGENPDLWENSFWNDVENISQLDGSCDLDDHKKTPVRKKKQSIRIGLSRKTSKAKLVEENVGSEIMQVHHCSEKPTQSKEVLVGNKIDELKTNLSPHKSPKSTPRKIKLKANLSPYKSPKSTPRKFKSAKSSPRLSIITTVSPVKKALSKNVHKSLNFEQKTIFDSVTPDEVQNCTQFADKLKNCEPVPGCSKDLTQNLNLLEFAKDCEPIPGCSKDLDSSGLYSPESNSQDIKTVSFYDKSFFQDTNMYEDSSDSIESEKFQLHFEKSASVETLMTKRPLTDHICILTPKNCPPSRRDVISSMDKYNIPSCKYDDPYYSNYKDVGHQIEVGQVILKVKGRNISDLQEFESSLPITTLNEHRKEKFSRLNHSQCVLPTADINLIVAGNEPYCLTPLAKPPSNRDIKKYLSSLKNTVKKSNENNDEIVNNDKIVHIPLSPEQNMNESDCEAFSISPCSSQLTPNQDIKSSSEDIHKTSYETPKLSKTQLASIKTRKSLSQPTSRRKSLRLSLAERRLSQNISTCDEESQNVENKASLSKLTDFQTSYSPNMTETLGFKYSGENYQENVSGHKYEHLIVMSVEVLTDTRGDYNPDPEIDPVVGFFYYVKSDSPETFHLPQSEMGVIVVEENAQHRFSDIDANCKVNKVSSESDLFIEIIKLIEKWNPDILCGYEIELMSWGYLFQRSYKINLNLPAKTSRVFTESEKSYKFSSQEESKRNFKLIGRILLNVWHMMRHEVALSSYTFENVTYHVLHERLPKFSYKTLSFWWHHPSGLLKRLSVDYMLTRAKGTVDILQQLDIIGRTSELAKLFGIQWYEVLSRGSQFRVESMMIRMARSLNFIMVSPSVQQRASMKAPECLPLILEPESRFYKDPVIVLDFQSLYPSMMIAYNYCFSTCIGKVQNMGRNLPFEFGATRLRVSRSTLKKLNEMDAINWSPCGVGFVKPFVRKGIIPKMLEDILSTRFMVKKAMKKHKKNKTLQKILHSRQLGLKLIANVTYGYTAANFSGRMPCCELGDSVVAKGRETLERAITMVENTPEWNAKVVYGDTDSLFVLVPGKSREDAFKIGEQIAEAVTNDNPNPVKLKLEKIYQPCILQTKKRYVGYMYESKDQKKPEFNAKGIETVRRDGCPITVKMLEKCLRILFETNDVSKVKQFVCKKFQNIIEGKTPIRDFIFAKEFRGINSYKPGACIPALEIARKLRTADPRKEPRQGERIPYVIVSGAPGQPLLYLAKDPKDLINNPAFKIDYNYYITRVIIPPINRCFNLIGVDLHHWYKELPRRHTQMYPILEESKNSESKKTISQYFAKINCAACDKQTTNGLCEKCLSVPSKSIFILQNKINRWQRSYNNANKICQSCCERSGEIGCISIDCPVLYKKNTCKQELDQKYFIQKMIDRIIDN